ncbi:MAG: hypothetical protein ACXV7J_14150 [Methylomonas sp.]
MKNTQLTHGLLIALSLGASAASAQDYPAADFQPKVVFQDPSIIEQAPSKPAAASSSSAVPCVPEAAKTEVQAENDPKYPAANFQPKVIFSN